VDPVRVAVGEVERRVERRRQRRVDRQQREVGEAGNVVVVLVAAAGQRVAKSAGKAIAV